MYCPRLIDSYLAEWASRKSRKPLLLRGARQVGKSSDRTAHRGESRNTGRNEKPLDFHAREKSQECRPMFVGELRRF